MIILLCAILTGFVVGKCTRGAAPCDTLFITSDSVFDTIYTTYTDTTPPEPVIVERVKTVEVKVPYIVNDTVRDSVKVEMPVVSKTYKDSLYTAHISGVEFEGYPRLDSISVYSPVITKTVTTTITLREKRKPWAVVLSAGPSYDFTNNKVGGSVMLGLGYKIFEF